MTKRKKVKPRQPSARVQDALRILADIRLGNAEALSNLRTADKLLGMLVEHGPTKKAP